VTSAPIARPSYLGARGFVRTVTRPLEKVTRRAVISHAQGSEVLIETHCLIAIFPVTLPPYRFGALPSLPLPSNRFATVRGNCPKGSADSRKRALGRAALSKKIHRECIGVPRVALRGAPDHLGVLAGHDQLSSRGLVALASQRRHETGASDFC